MATVDAQATPYSNTVIAAGMGVGFVLSRTVGLPGFHESEWELSGLVSLLLEAGFLAAALAWARTVLPARDGSASTAT